MAHACRVLRAAAVINSPSRSFWQCGSFRSPTRGSHKAEIGANAVAPPSLSSPFGVLIPGRVTLPFYEGQQSITEHVTGLESLRRRFGKVSGVFADRWA
ncbi:hypothetical protein [Aquincola tertiaricarbonis]|uniref:hypothetical protein n=1 Tax=Aquincola tertiaricarbonis TaxID=391953 RepID=UPI0018DB26BD|nr:hypothetical protein [Aquincola tertiaricarbonis]